MRPPRAPVPLSEPPDPPARYSRLALPPYRHVPGLTPHPVKDPRGHLYGAEEPAPSVECTKLPGGWRECVDYLYGVDLFNRAYLWEAHESWEAVWIAVGKRGRTAAFVQGMIQVAAALLREHLQTPGGARSLLAKARRNLTAAQSQPPARDRNSYMGVAVGPWLLAVDRYLEHRGSAYPYLDLDFGG